MFRAPVLALALALATLTALPRHAHAQVRTPEGKALLETLNQHPTVASASESAKSWRLLFDAWLDTAAPPQPIGDDFGMVTIWPGMDGWSAVADWAESHPAMADAIMKAKDRKIIGLPYGQEQVPANYRENGVMIAFAPGGRIRIDFHYLGALEGISALATAEIYRRMEAGQVQEGLDLSIAFLTVLRQFCDRDFLEEKTTCIWMMSQALGNLRDVFFRYQSEITPEQFTKIAWWELPYLRPDRGRLFMPEGDRVVSDAILKFVFDESSGSPDPERFVEMFAEMQAAEQPLTQFGTARRWKMLAEVHGSLDASAERLERIYDDWWRRWRVQEYDPILDLPSQFERTNEIRYAAVVESIDDLQTLFPLRNQLMAETFGTAVAAGLCGYKNFYNNYPRQTEMIYSQFVRKICDFDPFDIGFRPFRYRMLSATQTIDTPDGRIRIAPNECILYSVGQNHVDEAAKEHSDDGYYGDLIIWPPMKSMQREQGLID